MTQPRSVPVSVQKCVQIVGAGVLAAALGLIVTSPLREAIAANANCKSQRGPATLIINSQGQAADACVIALSVFE